MEDGKSDPVRQSVAKALRGVDEAIKKSAEAGQGTVRRIVDSGRGVSEKEMRQAFESLQKVEQQFIASIGAVAETASQQAPEQMRERTATAARASTENAQQAAAAMTELTQRFAGTSVELSLTCLQLTGEFSARFAQIAGGWLNGMADALDKAPVEGEAAAGPKKRT